MEANDKEFKEEMSRVVNVAVWAEAKESVAAGLTAARRERTARAAMASEASRSRDELSVQLGQAETFGVHNHHDGGVGNVDADFDHGRGHQDVY